MWLLVIVSLVAATVIVCVLGQATSPGDTTQDEVDGDDYVTPPPRYVSTAHFPRKDTEHLIHLAGEHDPSRGQHCVICGFELVPSDEGATSQNGQGHRAFAQGAMVLIQKFTGGMKLVSVIDPVEADTSTSARRCTPKDGES